MLLLTKSRLRVSWCVLAGVTALASLLPDFISRDPNITANINMNWVHFLVYFPITTLPILAWRLRTGLVISLGVGILPVAAQLVHGVISGRGTDPNGIVINLLGIASGTLLGLNILALRTHTKE